MSGRFDLTDKEWNIIEHCFRTSRAAFRVLMIELF